MLVGTTWPWFELFPLAAVRRATPITHQTHHTITGRCPLCSSYAKRTTHTTQCGICSLCASWRSLPPVSGSHVTVTRARHAVPIVASTGSARLPFSEHYSKPEGGRGQRAHLSLRGVVGRGQQLLVLLEKVVVVLTFIEVCCRDVLVRDEHRAEGVESIARHLKRILLHCVEALPCDGRARTRGHTFSTSLSLFNMQRLGGTWRAT
jgi:hypothetical protein